MSLTRASILLLTFCLWTSCLSAQKESEQRLNIEINRANLMRPLTTGEEGLRLIGDVELAHGDAILRCDSARFYMGLDILMAYGNVSVDNGVNRITGDSLFYEGESGDGRMEGRSVVLYDNAQDANLWTDKLLFNTRTNEATYQTWGRLRSGQNWMTSQRGYYFSDQRLVVLSGKVRFMGKEMDAFGDSIEYYQPNERLYYWGPTRLYQKSQMVFSGEGWYDQQLDLLDARTDVLVDYGTYRMRTDHLVADNLQGYSYATGATVLEDSLSKNRLYARKVEYWRSRKRVEASDSPMLWTLDTTAIPYDTLYVSAKRMEVWQVPVERQVDSIPTIDTVQNALFTGDLKLYSHAWQLVADSVDYVGADSIAHVTRSPVPYFWQNDLQASAQLMDAYIGSKGIDSVHMAGRVLLGIWIDGKHYDQMLGQSLMAHFADQELSRMNMSGETEVIFFLRDPDKRELMGINNVKSPRFSIYFKDQQASEVRFYEKPVSTVIPLARAQSEDRFLFGFTWQKALRPSRSADVIPTWIQRIDFFRESWDTLAPIRAEDEAKLRARRKDNPPDQD